MAKKKEITIDNEFGEADNTTLSASEPTQGVLIIALGHGLYGKYAQALAASIRVADPQIPICLVWAGSTLKEISAKNRTLFSEIIECPKEYYTRNGKTVWHRPKCYMDLLSPYDKTLFLGADTVVFHTKKVSDLLAELNGVGFTAQNYGYFDFERDNEKEFRYYPWCNPLNVKKALKLSKGKFYVFQSSLVYFEKSQKTSNYFEKVRESIDNNATLSDIPWNGDIPDELAFNIASVTANTQPHKDLWQPVLIPMHVSDVDLKNRSEIYNKYLALTMAGNTIESRLTNIYNAIVQNAEKVLKLDRLTPYRDKKGYIDTRKIY